MTRRGILSFGAYVPRRRLDRRAIAAAHAWANPNLKALARGTRAICGQDEDSLTMAVAAGAQALAALDMPAVAALSVASTTMPFADRQNATLIGEALALPDTLATADLGGSLRAGVAALRAAFERPQTSLVVAADKRHTRPASAQEMRVGDAAAALVVGEGEVLAEFVAGHALSVDFVDHYRASDADFDYALEERWARDMGALRILPRAIEATLTRAGVAGAAVARVVMAGFPRREAEAIAAKCGLAAAAIVDDLIEPCGDSGCAHPLLLLTLALQSAAPGDLILVVGYGQGAETLLLRATDAIGRAGAMVGAAQMLADGTTDDNYLRFLSFSGALALDWGMRAERDNRTAQSAFFRHRQTVTGFVGGRCTACDTAQFPRTRVCVNPDCRQTDTQVAEPFADKTATVKSFTEDWLALSYSPPLMYGNVRFAGGGVTMLEFSDFAPGALAVDTPLALAFRLKDVDARRGFRRYCWKAVPPRRLSA